MREDIFNAYRDDGWHLFKLVKTDGGGGNAVKGKYMTPKGWNDTDKVTKYNPNAIYGGVPPKDMVAIDWDVKNGKKQGDKSFEQLQKDLCITIETIVSTPSGGGHAYMSLPDDTKLKKAQEKYPDIDFQSHGSEFVVLGGQTIEGYGEYAFVDEDFEYFRNNGVVKTELLKHLEIRADRVEGGGYESIDDFEHISTRPPIEEIKSILDRLDPNMGHDDGWQTVIMSLNSWDLNGEVGLQLALDWSLKSDEYSERASEEGYDLEEGVREKYYACVSDTPTYYNKLYTLVNKADENRFREKLASADSEDDFEELATEISNSSVKNTLRTSLADEMATKERDLGFVGRKSKKKWDDKLARHVHKEPSDVKELEDTQLYLCDGKHVIRHGYKIIEDVGTQMLGKYLKTFGFGKEEQDILQNNLIPIYSVRFTTSYVGDEEVTFSMRDNAATNLQSLVVHTNPLINVDDYIHDEEIINDFFKDVWNGKAEDIVKIIALTIKTGEQKLNRLMTVAPSNTGKSEIFSMMKFQKITMKRLLNGLRGDKGIGSSVIDGIRKSGLLMIDEANNSLEAEIKDMDKELHVDQFGSGGTQILPLHFTALTSTHKTATRNNSDELYNRFLQVELTPKEVKHTLMQSQVFLRDTDRYTDVVSSYLLSLFRTTMTNDEGKAELQILQDKYRLPINNDLDVILFEISEAFIEETRTSATDDGDVLTKAGAYYYKRKGDVISFFEDRLGEIASLDVGKYSELLTTHFLGEASGKSIRIDGKPVKYYEVSLVPFTKDENVKVTAMFDDLDEKEL